MAADGLQGGAGPVLRMAIIDQQGAAAVHGPVTQGAFLRSLGIELRARQLLEGAARAQKGTIEAALRRLIDPAEMGTLSKALAICDRDLATPPGFETAASTG